MQLEPVITIHSWQTTCRQTLQCKSAKTVTRHSYR